MSGERRKIKNMVAEKGTISKTPAVPVKEERNYRIQRTAYFFFKTGQHVAPLRFRRLF